MSGVFVRSVDKLIHYVVSCEYRRVTNIEKEYALSSRINLSGQKKKYSSHR